MLSTNWVRCLLVGLGFAVSQNVYATQSSIPVSDDLSIRFEASDGTQGSPESLKLVMMNPPQGLDQLELQSELSPLSFAADCNTKQVRIHDRDGAIDTDWTSVDHGDFEFSLNSPSIRLANDGQGHRNCMADIVLHIRGKLDCHNSSAPGLNAEIAYQFSSERDLMAMTAGTRGPAKMCSLPRDSFLLGRI